MATTPSFVRLSPVACSNKHPSPYEPEQLEALVIRAQGGDMRAQNELIIAYQARIAGFVYAMLGRTAPVDDLSQDIFSKMIRGLPRLHDTKLFEAWLFRTARNQCIDHARREKWRRMFTLFDPTTDDQPMEVDQDRKDRVDAVMQMLQRLPTRDRSLLLMAQEGLSLAEMAASTGTTTTTIKTRLHRARERLKELYEKRT